MRNLDYQAILDRVYMHFVIDRQPPGIVDGHILYHQTDHNGNECPCAIGLFDAGRRLDHTDSGCPNVENLYLDCPALMANVFNVDSLSREDADFLATCSGITITTPSDIMTTTVGMILSSLPWNSRAH